MNEKLQKWAEEKAETMKKWSEEYDSICKEEGIEGNNIISLAFDRDYVASIYAHTDDTNREYLFNTEAVFNTAEGWDNEKEACEEE